MLSVLKSIYKHTIQNKSDPCLKQFSYLMILKDGYSKNGSNVTVQIKLWDVNKCIANGTPDKWVLTWSVYVYQNLCKSQSVIQQLERITEISLAGWNI